MKGRRIVLGEWNGREAAALVLDGRLDDLLLDHPHQLRPGAILRALCDRPLKGQGGMILRLPDGGQGWLRQATSRRPGEPLLVQVTGVPEGGKAVPLTDRILFKGRFAIVTPGAPGVNVSRRVRDGAERGRLEAVGAAALGEAPHGLILRSAAVEASDEDLTGEIASLLALAEQVLTDGGREPELLVDGDGPHALALREWTASDIVDGPSAFEREGLIEQVEALRSPVARLEDGGSLSIEVTRAVVAVDVNTGSDTSGAAALKANLAAARLLPRQLRLRGLGGQIVVDFVSMSKAHRRTLEQSLRDSFRNDPVETSLVGWTAMGLYEISRKRERVPLAVLAGEP
ncbi:ribonuclease E/G [Rubellimicrobium sp. CFH 75288]|uniref:ribonuclease E/G n=1 Tax=Rubellimicrobium sp. CFH 75288 TaxID=2697034 RepID=UPI0014126965|nr:ribonuclease E/G [Rubellimicrobium sp. CFH 75288]NAZ37119.1 ribonuclease G [Rubellimicrobium sp. CFH 75288]